MKGFREIQEIKTNERNLNSSNVKLSREEIDRMSFDEVLATLSNIRNNSGFDPDKRI